MRKLGILITKKMKFKIFFLTILSLCISCTNRLNTTDKKGLEIDSIYSDFDLFNFKGLKSKDIGYPYIKVKEDSSKKILTVFDKNTKSNFIYIKDKNGYFVSKRESQDIYITDITYTVYTKEKVLIFDLMKLKNDSDMMLGSHKIIFPLDSKNRQLELTYKYPLKRIKELEDIEYLDILNSHEEIGYEYKSYYIFDFQNKKCTYYLVDKDKLIVSNVFYIGNSKSRVTPLYYYWKLLK